MTKVTANKLTPPPSWALSQRHLIAMMNAAAPRYQARYTRADGTFIWRQEWPGMDGSDDGYESYHNWPLFYALGGAADFDSRSRFLWDAVTRQFTAYGQVWREYDAYYDWMHHGESSLFFYYFGLSNPNVAVDRARTARFARMYTGEDPLAPNWDAEHRMMRSPITGSKGPRFENSWGDWSTHRAVLAHYPPPFDDIGIEGPLADWNDDETYATILKALNERQMRGDVPLNLTSTSLITHAYTYSGDPKLRTWVLDYLEAWNDRIKANGGLCPDNVGPNGVVGELMGGKWWGGYYGWRWPHGFMSIIQPLTIAAMNAVMLTGDMRYLDIPRGQLDYILDRGHLEGERLLVPNRYTDNGWTAFRPISPEYPLQIWAMSQDRQDEERLQRFPERKTDWKQVLQGHSKGDTLHIAPWYCYHRGELPDYPEQILGAQWNEVTRRMNLIANDNADPEEIDVHHWQDRNPVRTEALVQLTCGGPQVIYHGGLLHVRLRYYDAVERRPGLPADVAALVDRLDGESVDVELVNTNAFESRSLIMQSGAFGEHRFSDLRRLDEEGANSQAINDKWVRVELPPSSSLKLRLCMDRYVNQPSYEQPSY